MLRRVWIVPRKEKIEDSDIASATLNGCPEIANGIPPALESVISPAQLPIAYEEPEPPKPKLPRDLAEELDTIKAKIADYDNLKARVGSLETRTIE